MSSQVHKAKEAFGARLRDLRKDANLTGRALATATGLHFTKVSRIEHARQNPSEDDIRLWCRACGAEDQIPEETMSLRSTRTGKLQSTGVGEPHTEEHGRAT